jgi:hypothetical protein
MSELIDGQTIDYWFRKLKLYIVLHGGIKWWQGNSMDRRPCGKICPWGKSGWCDRPIGDKRLRVSYDLKRISNIEKGDYFRSFCAEWVKHV